MEVFNHPPLSNCSGNDSGGTTGECCDYIRNIPTPVTVGGVSSGDTFNGTTIDVLDRILYPYQKPRFSSFYISGIGNKEVGFTYTAGEYNFIWSVSNPDNIKLNSIKITDLNTNIVLVDNVNNEGSLIINLNELSKDTNGSYKWRIEGLNTNDETFYKDFTTNWYHRFYYGEDTVDHLIELGVKELRAFRVSSTPSGVYDFIEGGYKYLAYPKSLGLRSSFIDNNNGNSIAMDEPYTINITNEYGLTMEYYIHKTYNILGGSISFKVNT